MAVQRVKPELRLLLGLLVQLVSQTGEFLWFPASLSPFWGPVRPVTRCRHRVFTQSVLHSSYTQLANGRAPSFHGRYPASSLLCAPPTPVHAAFRLCLPLVVGFHPPDGSPRFLDQSFDTRRPQPPRLSSTVAFARSSPWIPDFGTSGILGRLASSVSRPNRVHLRYGSRLRFERLRSTNYSILRSRSYMAYEHFTWQAPFFLLD